MSGSGGGGGRDADDISWRTPRSGGGQGGGDVATDQCAIYEKTYLNSPNPAVVGSLKAGDKLAVFYEAGPPMRVVAKVQSTGQTAGSLTPRRLADLTQCLRDGRTYSATVKEINGGAVSVEIAPDG